MNALRYRSPSPTSSWRPFGPLNFFLTDARRNTVRSYEKYGKRRSTKNSPRNPKKKSPSIVFSICFCWSAGGIAHSCKLICKSVLYMIGGSRWSHEVEWCWRRRLQWPPRRQRRNPSIAWMLGPRASLRKLEAEQVSLSYSLCQCVQCLQPLNTSPRGHLKIWIYGCPILRGWGKVFMFGT